MKQGCLLGLLELTWGFTKRFDIKSKPKKKCVITVISDKEEKKMATCNGNTNKGCPHREEGGSTKSGYLRKRGEGRVEQIWMSTFS